MCLQMFGFRQITHLYQNLHRDLEFSTEDLCLIICFDLWMPACIQLFALHLFTATNFGQVIVHFCHRYIHDLLICILCTKLFVVCVCVFFVFFFTNGDITLVNTYI